MKCFFFHLVYVNYFWIFCVFHSAGYSKVVTPAYGVAHAAPAVYGGYGHGLGKFKRFYTSGNYSFHSIQPDKMEKSLSGSVFHRNFQFLKHCLHLDYRICWIWWIRCFKSSLTSFDRGQPWICCTRLRYATIKNSQCFVHIQWEESHLKYYTS